ncbi:MAG: hydrogenobyrinic acid a,c-diamide synthase (glutamine-hydrolyzing) [Deltaproteobacteria bacterium]|nr:hydrogenobyrinic acid a,c-diamide synthase (glutamine-hydrolyzing) [Deltaproteobacteria bacterium]
MNKIKAPPRIVVGAPWGYSGKTVISCAITKILKEKGIKIQTFKKGPDYIDPSWLKAASGRPCRNLDLFLMGKEETVRRFFFHSAGCDFVLIEGNMGLYDGIEEDGSGSTAHISRILKAPVIIVVNTQKMTRTVAALVEGLKSFEPDTMISGVILNNVSGERHARKLLSAIEKYSRISVLGIIPRDKNLLIDSRHLGLVPFEEKLKNYSILEKIANFTEKHLDIEAILEIGRKAQEFWLQLDEQKSPVDIKTVRIGVFYDHVFNFYYPENLEALESYGAELVFINSVRDSRLPEIDGLYIGGGFPELYLEELSSNRGLMQDVFFFVQEGNPLYAECGGLMYLCDHIHFGGRKYRMSGLIPAEVFLTKRPQAHGYVEAEVVGQNPYYPLGTVVRGHEFHHSALKLTNRVDFIFKMRRGKGGYGLNDGILYKNMLASYTHIHSQGVSSWAENFVNLCLTLKGRRKSNYIIREVTHG